MKSFRVIICLICFLILQGTVALAHPYDVYPNICGNNYTKPNQTPPYSQPYINQNSYPYWRWNSYDTYVGKRIYVQNPHIVYDNGGLIPIGNFIERAGKNYFMYLDGVFARNTWLNTKGKWYYFDNSSEMLRGWVTINGLTYYFNDDGCMATGTTTIDGVTHYFDAVGAKVF